MKEIIRGFLISFVFMYVITGCEKTKIQFGQQYIDNGNTNIVLVDSLLIDVSTLYHDSLASSGSEALLAGTCYDNVFGKITAQSYFVISPPTLTDLAINAVYDSIVLLVRPDKSYSGDTTLPSQFYIHKLTEALTFATGETHFYTNTIKAVQATPLGFVNIMIKPTITDTVRIRLSDIEGLNLFQLFKSRANEMQSTDNFITYFKGLRLSGGANNRAVYGFYDSIILRLYYHESNVFTEKFNLDFNFVNPDHQYNQISADRTGTPLQSFSNSNNEVSSKLTNNESYTQLLTGFSTKIKFPTVKNLLLEPDFIKILKAELTVKPVNNSYTGYPLPPEVVPVNIDASNTLNSSLGAYNATGSFIPETGDLVLDNIYNSNTSYTYDVTSFMQTLIKTTTDSRTGITLLPNSYKTSLKRLIAGNHENIHGKMQLKLYYISINK